MPFFSAIQSHCPRISVVLPSYDSRLTLIQYGCMVQKFGRSASKGSIIWLAIVVLFYLLLFLLFVWMRCENWFWKGRRRRRLRHIHSGEARIGRQDAYTYHNLHQYVTPIKKQTTEHKEMCKESRKVSVVFCKIKNCARAFTASMWNICVCHFYLPGNTLHYSDHSLVILSLAEEHFLKHCTNLRRYDKKLKSHHSCCCVCMYVCNRLPFMDPLRLIGSKTTHRWFAEGKKIFFNFLWFFAFYAQ